VTLKDILRKHAAALEIDMEYLGTDNSEVLHPEYKAIRKTVITLLQEIQASLRHDDSDRITRELILALMDFLQRWERWTSRTPVLRDNTKSLHELAIRYCKGTVKHLRAWRIDNISN
jgi:hypothetical protein